MATTPWILLTPPLIFFSNFLPLLIPHVILPFQTSTAAVFTIENLCDHTIWPGTLSGNGAPSPDDMPFPLLPTQSFQYTVTPGWSGRFWPRTGCNFDSFGNGSCITGDCGGTKCSGSGAPPVTLVEFTIGEEGEKDFYDVSLVDGYNVGVEVGAAGEGGRGDCQKVKCVIDLVETCPLELQEKDENGEVVACRSACLNFNRPEYCCSGEFSTPDKCPPTDYSVMFKNACPGAYSYAYDDTTSTCTCTGTDYVITFCPLT